jgi:hypothetical protein
VVVLGLFDYRCHQGVSLDNLERIVSKFTIIIMTELRSRKISTNEALGTEYRKKHVRSYEKPIVLVHVESKMQEK